MNRRFLLKWLGLAPLIAKVKPAEAALPATPPPAIPLEGYVPASSTPLLPMPEGYMDYMEWMKKIADANPSPWGWTAPDQVFRGPRIKIEMPEVIDDGDRTASDPTDSDSRDAGRDTGDR